MTYIVTWAVPTALELARVATALDDPTSADREAVWMDSILRRYPNAMGESREGNERVWYADVLGIWYRVDDQAMRVTVLSVGPARRH